MTRYPLLAVAMLLVLFVGLPFVHAKSGWQPVAQKAPPGIKLAGLQLLPASLPDNRNDAKGQNRQLTFDTPLISDDTDINGKTLAELAKGTPLFSPLDGLPDAVWKGKTCSSCHAWGRDALCTQGATYLNVKTAAAVNKKHPFGGGFKRNLMTWAEQGCP